MQTVKSKRCWKLFGALALALALLAGAPSTHAASSARIMLNGQPLATSIPPLVRSGSTLVPMRDIFEALGATVVWDRYTQEINAQKDATRIWLQIGNRNARVGDEQKWLSQAPIIYRQNTMVPLRFVSEALGADVDWDGNRRLVLISTNERITTRPALEDRSPDYVAPTNTSTNTEVRGTITIPAGAVVPVTLDETISSATARVGDTFTATVKSEKAGDSEFPPDTKLRGRITEVRSKAEQAPGILGVQFTHVILPGGNEQPIRGDLISLDDESVTDQSEGRIMAKPGRGGTDLKIVGVGAAAGFILGKVLDENSLITAILGAAGAYLYDRSRDKGKEQEAVVNAGTTLGVRLARSVTYTDIGGYYDERRLFLD